MTIFESMLADYRGSDSGTAKPNAEQEVCQKIALAGLNRGGFFDHAAFYGGTCLRLFHGLPRFSEDMDFSLTEKRGDVHLDNYFDAIRDEFSIAGFEVEITKKEKKKLRQGGVRFPQRDYRSLRHQVPDEAIRKGEDRTRHRPAAPLQH